MIISVIALVISLINILYITSVHKTILHTVKLKYRKIKSLKELVQSQHKNILMILWVSLCIICKTFYISICQYLNRSIRRIDKNTYEISYTINGILYKMIVKPKKGPKCIIEAVDENDNDMTHLLLSYIGPMENFHGVKITPKFFNKEKIIFSLSDGNERSFHVDEELFI